MALPELPLTREAQLAVQKHLGSCANPGLIYERYVKYRQARRNWEPEKQSTIERTIESQKQQSHKYQRLWSGFQERWQQTIGEALTFEAYPDFRFITGLGRGGPLEVGFTFHRIYGFPLIPGSGLKGLARTYALIELAEMLGTSEVDRLEKDISQDDDPEFRQTFASHMSSEAAKNCAQRFRVIFGTTDQAGQAIFYDAIPLNNPVLESEVMTPHYPDYYQGPEPPADWQNPNPIQFLVVGRETLFQFAVGWREKPEKTAHEQAVTWLEKGLQELGAGAKTSSGYGYFQIIDHPKYT